VLDDHLTALATRCVGDVVRINHHVSPRYLTARRAPLSRSTAAPLPAAR
jgi:hypothetical protein